MDSPVRQYQKQKDYRRHKLFRKINRRRKAERQQAIDAPMKELRRKLKQYKDGKDSDIHIKPENRGKFNKLRQRTGKSASWFKAHGTPAQKKMATFALNARKWKHK